MNKKNIYYNLGNRSNETIENALTNSLKAHSTDESYNSAITRLVTGANYLYGLVPVTLLLLAFLVYVNLNVCVL